MSLVDQLINDLQQIYQETKKNQPLRQVLQIFQPQEKFVSTCLDQVKQFRANVGNLSQSQSPSIREAFPTQILIKLIQQICQVKPDSKNIAMFQHVPLIIQKMNNFNVFQGEDYTLMLWCLQQIKEIPDDQVQLKIVQCMHQMVHKLELHNTENYEKLINLMLYLSGSKNPIVQSTSITGLQQLINLIFELHARELKNGQKISKQCIKQIFFFFEMGQHYLMIQLEECKVKKQHGFRAVTQKGRDILMDIIKQLDHLILKDENFVRLIQDNISLVIYEEMALDDNDIQFNARRIRAAFRLIKHLRLDFALVKHISLLFYRAPQYHFIRYWILEGIYDILQDSELLIMLSQQPENNFPLENTQHLQQQQAQTSYLQHLIHLIKVTVDQDQQTTPKSALSPSQILQLQSQKITKFMDSGILDFSDTPAYTSQQFNKLCIDCTFSLSETMQQIAKEQGVQLGQRNLNIKTPLIQIIDQIQVMVAKYMKHLLSQEKDERILQNLLNATQIWISISGSLGCLKVRDQFLKILQICVTENEKDQLTEKNFQSSKTLFNIAHCLAGILDEKSWFLVLQTIQVFEAQLSKFPQPSLQQNLNETQMCAQEPTILQSVLDDIFTQSHLFDDQQLLYVLDALYQLTLSTLEQSSTYTQKDYDNRALLFCLKKIQMMVKVNWDRVNIFWQTLDVQFSCVVNCKQSTFRIAAVETLANIIQEGFFYFQRAYSSKNDDQREISPVFKHPDSKWNRGNWQQSILQPINEIIIAKFPETRQATLTFILKLIQNNGHEFVQNGFMSIIQALKSCSQNNSVEIGAPYIQTAFQILELIIQQYLNVLEPSTTRDLLPLIQEFRNKTQESNISFISVGLIWQLADNLGKLNNANETFQMDQIEDLWSLVIYTLKDLCLDNAADVRQSALHIIVQITLLNCASLRIKFQITLLREVHLNIFDSLIGRVAQLQNQQSIFVQATPKFLNSSQTPKFTKFLEADFKNQQLPLWDETLKLMVQNLSKVIKKLQNIQEFHEYSQGIHDEIFVRMFMMFRLQNIELKNEIAKFIRENTESITSKFQEQSLEWSREMICIILNIINFFIEATNDFMFQKYNDQRDQRTLINKILPEICETFVLLLKAHKQNQKTYPELVDQLLDCYQNIIEQPSKFNPPNSKLWFDEKYLHDFASDFIQNSKDDEVQYKILSLLNRNLSKPQGQHTMIDQMLRKFMQLYTNTICEQQYILRRSNQDQSIQYIYNAHSELLIKFIQSLEVIIQQRSDPVLLQAVKIYNSSSTPLWNTSSVYLQEVFSIYQNQYNNLISKVIQKILTQNESIEKYSYEAQRSCHDLEVSWCEWAIENNFSSLASIYWKTLSQRQNNPDELFYGSRKSVISSLFSKADQQDAIQTLLQIIQEILQNFNKDEQLFGSMPLQKSRVQETVFVLQELLKLSDLQKKPLLHFFSVLTDLITTREQEIKIPLQQLFRQISVIIQPEQ